MVFKPALRLLAISAVAFGLAACQEEHGLIEQNGKSIRPLRQDMIELMAEKGMRKEDPILVRIFKQDSVLEVWKRDKTGRYALLKDYKICAWGGTIGPKIRQGDKQSPEGFYTVTPSRMNPNSQYYLSYDVGFPNAFDRAYGRTGDAIMVHGACSSAGCFAMTDAQVEEIYALAREAFAGGQPSFQVQSFPFRMTAQNMARNRNNPNMPFWRNLKEGYDHFEVTKVEPKVDVCEKRYVFNAQPKDPAMSTFNAVGACPVYEVPSHIATLVAAKSKADEAERSTVIAALDEKERKATQEELDRRLEESKPKREGGSLMASIFRSGQGEASPATTGSAGAARTPIAVPIPRAAPGRIPSQPAQPVEVAKADQGVGSWFGFASKSDSETIGTAKAGSVATAAPASTAVVMPAAPPRPAVAPAPAPVPVGSKPAAVVAPAPAPVAAVAAPKPERSIWQRLNPFGG